MTRRLADAALARRDEQRPGPRAGLGEGDLPALGVAVRRLRGRRVAAGSPWRLHAQRLALLVGHHGEVEVDAARRRRAARTAPVDPVLDLVAQRAAGDGEGDEHADRRRRLDVDVAHHAEVDDRAVQLGILHRTERLDDLLGGDGHRRACLEAGPMGISTTAIGRIPAWTRRRHRTAPTGLEPTGEPGEFSAAVTAITNAFGDPTRREIYLFAHEPRATGSPPRRWPSTSGSTPTSPATTSTSSPPAATSRSRSSAASTAARAARRSATGPRGEQVTLDVPVRTDDLVLTLLGRALALLPPDRGRAHGRGGRRSSTAGPWPPA